MAARQPALLASPPRAMRRPAPAIAAPVPVGARSIAASWLAGALLLALACAAPRPPPPPPPAAFFWDVTTPVGGKLYLLGSVHIGATRELWLTPPVASAWLDSERLVVEVDTRGLDTWTALDVTGRYGLLPPEQSLRDVIAPRTHAALLAWLRAHRQPVEAVERMRPWLVVQIVTRIAFESAGFDAENGVDAWFLRRADGVRPVEALERLEEQMALYAGLPSGLAELVLRDVLAESASFPAMTERLLRAWERGDEALLLELLLGGRDDPALAAFHEQVFVARNHRMAERLAALVADGLPRFAVLGTGHLIGPESVPELLAASGFAVRRVPDAFVFRSPLETLAPLPAGSVAPGSGGAAPEPMR